MKERAEKEGAYFGTNALTVNGLLDILRAESSDKPVIGREASLFLIRDIISGLELSYRNIRKIENTVYGIIGNIKYANLTAGRNFSANSFSDGRWKEIWNVYERYEERLYDAGLDDDADVLKRTIDGLPYSRYLDRFSGIDFKGFLLFEKEEDLLVSGLGKFKDITISVGLPAGLKDEYLGEIAGKRTAGLLRVNEFNASPPPSVFRSLNRAEEMERLLYLICREMREGSITIVTDDRGCAHYIGDHLAEEGIAFYSGHKKRKNDAVVNVFKNILTASSGGYSKSGILSLMSSKVFGGEEMFKYAVNMIKSGSSGSLEEWAAATAGDPACNEVIRGLLELRDLLLKSRASMSQAIKRIYDAACSIIKADMTEFTGIFSSITEVASELDALGIDMDLSEFTGLYDNLAGAGMSMEENNDFLSRVRILGSRDASTVKSDHIIFPFMQSGMFPRYPAPVRFFGSEGMPEEEGLPERRRKLSADIFRFKYLVSSANCYIGYHDFDDEGDPEIKSLVLKLPEFKGSERDIARAYTAAGKAGVKARYEKIADIRKRLSEADADQASLKEASAYAGILNIPVSPCYLSVSGLETYAGCPYKYFLEKMLRIEELQYEDEMTPMSKGRFFHALLFALRDMIKRNDTGEEKFKEVFKEVFTEQFARGGIGSSLLYVFYEKEYYNASLDLLRHLPSPFRDGFSPSYSELQIGGVKREGRNGDERSYFGDIILDLGPFKASFSAYLDRVDVNGKGDAVLIDYKTGTKTVSLKRKLNMLYQDYIYMKLYEKAGFGHASEFIFYNIREAKEGNVGAADEERIVSALSNILTNMGRGDFSFYPGPGMKQACGNEGEWEIEGKCGFCPFINACLRPDKNVRDHPYD